MNPARGLADPFHQRRQQENPFAAAMYSFLKA